ncbi:LANO_0F07932g1_1 [Lachancea nothofagi CBS 11611]|uniref:Mitochondrial 15S rRNA processing factor CCM1 n=1 Tax=Lachancea nothofagi CBS 11611 TaxID=1266666 RepID=A0A1G4K9A4_9SACH|nr:LANO_0F07932g1_1 [Lachancea nothofagi CBS 11611]
MLARNIDTLKPWLGCVFKRFVVVPASGDKSRRRRRNVRNVRRDVSVEDLELDKTLNLTDPRELEFKLRQLREFTRNLQAQIRVADDLTHKDAAQKELTKEELSKQNNTEATANLILGSKSGLTLSQQNSNLNTSEMNLSSFILSTSRQAQKFLPQILLDRINDDELVLKSLINHRSSDWNSIVSKLYNCPEKLQGVSHRILKVFILPKVSYLSLKNIRKLDSMLMDYIGNDGTRFTTAMYECMFLNLSNIKSFPNSTVSETFEFIESLLQRFDAAQSLLLQEKITDGSTGTSLIPKAEMNQLILNCCIKLASRLSDTQKMNYFLSKFKQDYDILPNRENYTTIAQYYSKLGLFDQAWDLFATMKFLSAEHKPDTKTYTTMLNICAKEKNYSKAIDLFNEMADLKIETSAETLNALTKVLAVASGDPVSSEGKGESLRLLGWKYLHQNEDLVNMRGRNLEDTIMTMMALCAYDGDAGLARALYFKYTTAKFTENHNKWKMNHGDSKSVDFKVLWSKSLNPYLFNYLLLAYANYSPDKLPLLLGFDQGAITRRNLINSVDYNYKFDEAENGLPLRLPMLPIADFNQGTQVLLESRALWQFNLGYGGTCDLREEPGDLSTKITKIVESSDSLDDFAFRILHQIALWKSTLVNHNVLSTKSFMSFLTIPIKMGDKTEFLLRLSEFSFQQGMLNDQISSLYNKVKSRTLPESEESSQSQGQDLNPTDNTEVQATFRYLFSMKHKILRDSSVHELAMRAAVKFQDVKLATQTWESRGAFRKTAAFQRLAPAERAKKDTAFASLMVDFFTDQQMFSDAMGIIMSSQRHISWNYAMVKKLHGKLVELEDKNSIRILIEIVNKRSKLDSIEPTTAK